LNLFILVLWWYCKFIERSFMEEFWWNQTKWQQIGGKKWHSLELQIGLISASWRCFYSISTFSYKATIWTLWPSEWLSQFFDQLYFRYKVKKTIPKIRKFIFRHPEDFLDSIDMNLRFNKHYFGSSSSLIKKFWKVCYKGIPTGNNNKNKFNTFILFEVENV